MIKPFIDNALRHILEYVHSQLKRRHPKYKTYLGECTVMVSLFYMNVMGKEDRIAGNPNQHTRSIQTNDASP